MILDRDARLFLQLARKNAPLNIGSLQGIIAVKEASMEKIVASVEGIIFRNEDNGYTVAEIALGDEPVSYTHLNGGYSLPWDWTAVL